jgi:hypothetical protein
MARTDREKRMLMALGATAIVAVLLVGFTLVFANGSKDSPPATRAGSGAKKPAATAPKAPAAPATQPSAAPLVFHGVDPFKPLANANQGSSGSTSGTSSKQAAPAPVQTPAGPASAVVGGKSVRLLDIVTKSGKKQAHVDVDGTTYAASAGDNFVDDFVLVSFADPCVQFAWRDQAFRLCVQPGSGG